MGEGLRQGGTVIALDGRVATVRIPAGAMACAACAEGRGCGAGLFRLVEARDRDVAARVSTGDLPGVGTTVSVECANAGVARAAAIAYGVPLAGFMAGVLVTSGAFPGQTLLAAALGIVAMVSAAWASRSVARRERPEWIVRGDLPHA